MMEVSAIVKHGIAEAMLSHKLKINKFQRITERFLLRGFQERHLFFIYFAFKYLILQQI